LPSLFSPEDLDGKPLALEELPLGIALVARKPAHRDLRIAGIDGQKRVVSVTAFQLFARADEFVGAVAVFWQHAGGERP
jgi:hypothetical protein